MPTAQVYPGARWTPLGAQREALMRSHDLIILHTMVGYLTSTDPLFRIYNGAGYIGTESHYGVGGIWGPDLGQALDGAVYQWQDRRYKADANLDAWYRAISIETADNAPHSPADIAAWTTKQMEAIAKIIAWESLPSSHAACPSTWKCHQVGIPIALVPNSLPIHRGVAYHRQGIDPWRVAGGEKWSLTDGKVCPGDRRIGQIPTILLRAKQIAAESSEPPVPPGDDEDMPTTRFSVVGDPDPRRPTYLINWTTVQHVPDTAWQGIQLRSELIGPATADQFNMLEFERLCKAVLMAGGSIGCPAHCGQCLLEVRYKAWADASNDRAKIDQLTSLVDALDGDVDVP